MRNNESVIETRNILTLLINSHNFNDKFIINNEEINYKKEFLNEIYDNILNVQEINILVNNCFKLLHEIELNRINELEKYLDMKFERFVYDKALNYNVYSWNSKYGFNTFDDIIKWHEILSKEESKNYISYNEIGNISKERKIYRQINYIRHIFTLPSFSFKNVYKLPISEEEKKIAYNILKP